jgi:hypothetical protein
MDQGQDQQANAGKMFHAEQGSLAEFPVAQRHRITQGQEPNRAPACHAGDAGHLAWPVGVDPAAGEKIRG